jgi:acyl-CoA synthetase (NDP forming)
VIFDGGFAEADAEGRARQEAIAAICREASMTLCGPNCMGVISPHVPSLVYIQAVHDPARLAGNVGMISQSGSICIGLLTDCRRFGWSQVISSGNEAVVAAVDFLEYLVEDPQTRVIAMFLESVRRARAVRRRARPRGRPRQARGRPQGRAQRPDPPRDHQPHRRPRRRGPRVLVDAACASRD